MGREMHKLSVFRQSKSTLYSLLLRAQTGWEKEGGLRLALSISERRRGGRRQSTNWPSGCRSFLVPHGLQALCTALSPVKQTSLACTRHMQACKCLHSQRTWGSGEGESHFGSLQFWSAKAFVPASRAEIRPRLVWLFNCCSVSRHKCWSTTRWALLHQEDQKIPGLSWTSWDLTRMQNVRSFV